MSETQPQPTATSGSVTTGNANAGGTGNDLAQTISQAVAAAVTSSVNELTAQFNQKFDSLSEVVTKTADTGANNFTTSVVGVSDPYESARRDRLHFDQVQQLSLQALANAVETANLVGKQAVRHADAWMAGAGNATSAVKSA